MASGDARVAAWGHGEAARIVERRRLQAAIGIARCVSGCPQGGKVAGVHRATGLNDDFRLIRTKAHGR